MKHAITFAMANLAAALFVHPADAAPPEHRGSCSMGYSALQLDQRERIETGGENDIRIGADGGSGFAADCALSITAGAYVYGGYRRHDASYDVALIGEEDMNADSFGLDVERWRIGLGYQHALGERVTAFAQIGYSSADYDLEPVFVILDDDGAQFDPANLGGRKGGLDLEAGINWRARDQLAFGVFLRFTENHRFALGDQPDLNLAQRNQDAVMAGGRARIDLSGPFYVRAEAVLGDIEEVAIGVGVDF